MSKEISMRKGLFLAIKESMKKSGGCCNLGETCGTTSTINKEIKSCNCK